MNKLFVGDIQIECIDASSFFQPQSSIDLHFNSRRGIIRILRKYGDIKIHFHSYVSLLELCIRFKEILDTYSRHVETHKIQFDSFYCQNFKTLLWEIWNGLLECIQLRKYKINTSS